jgi:hypothetical protein
MINNLNIETKFWVANNIEKMKISSIFFFNITKYYEHEKTFKLDGNVIFQPG